MSIQLQAVEVFYSYAQSDSGFHDELEKHLSALKRQGAIIEWHNRDIQAGKDWEHEINRHLNTADVILLLVSSDFLNSDYCYSVEMCQALERYRRKEARVIPILLRPVDYKGTPIESLPILPFGEKPITLWSDQDAAFFDIAKSLREVIREIQLEKASYLSYKAESNKAVIDGIGTIQGNHLLSLSTAQRMVIRWISLFVLILMVILGAILAAVQVRSYVSSKKGFMPNTPHNPPTLQASSATSTLRPSSTQSTPIIDPRSTVDPYATGSKLILDDDLASNDNAYEWRVSAPGSTGCHFINNTYDMAEYGSNYCLANKSNFSDFVYQIQIKIIRSKAGGIVFRANDAKNTYYSFLITTDGHFTVWRSDLSHTNDVLISHTPGFSSAINQGLNQTNLLAVRAIGSHLTFFVNTTDVDDLQDSTLTSGNIGIMAGQPDDSGLTEVAYRYARVWTL